MPYRIVEDLPTNLREILPLHAQEIFVKTFNNAWQEYQDTNRLAEVSHEEIAFRTAWSAVKKKYVKNQRTGKWELKD